MYLLSSWGCNITYSLLLLSLWTICDKKVYIFFTHYRIGCENLTDPWSVENVSIESPSRKWEFPASQELTPEQPQIDIERAPGSTLKPTSSFKLRLPDVSLPKWGSLRRNRSDKNDGDDVPGDEEKIDDENKKPTEESSEKKGGFKFSLPELPKFGRGNKDIVDNVDGGSIRIVCLQIVFYV